MSRGSAQLICQLILGSGVISVPSSPAAWCSITALWSLESEKIASRTYCKPHTLKNNLGLGRPPQARKRHQLMSIFHKLSTSCSSPALSPRLVPCQAKQAHGAYQSALFSFYKLMCVHISSQWQVTALH